MAAKSSPVTIHVCDPGARYPQHVNADGVLQCGDAFGFEAAWCLDQVYGLDNSGMPLCPQYPEEEWTMSQIEEDERGLRSVR